MKNSGALSATAAVKLFAIASGVVSTIISARILGPTDRGIFAATTTWATVISVLAGLSLPQIATYRIAARVNSFGAIRVKSSAVMLISALVSVTVVMVLRTFNSNLLGKLPFTLGIIAALIAAALMRESLNSALLLAAGRLDLYNRSVIIARTMAVAFVVIPLVMGAGVKIALGSLAVGTLLSAIYSETMVANCTTANSSGQEQIATISIMRDAAKLHPNAIAALLYSSAGILVLNAYSSQEDVAHFSLATQMLSIMLFPAQAVGTASYALAGQHGISRALPLQFKLFRKLSIIMLAFIALGFVLAKPAVLVVAGEEFRPAADVFHLLLPSVVGMVLMEVMAPQWITRGLFGLSSTITIAVGAISLISLLILVPTLGIRGAIIAHWITYGLAVVGNGSFAIHLRRQLRQKTL